jgi:enoyl-CoA hydratase/carnithine racemase
MSVVLTEHPSEGVLLIRINRPEQRNALNFETRKAIVAALQAASDNETVRAAVITGDDKAFAAGADLKELQALGPVETMRRGIHTLWDQIAAFPKPLIAAVNGFALGGGCELALHCDIIIAGHGAKFGLPETGVGILPGGSGTQRLTRAVGKYKAMWLALSGEFASGTDAAAMGLASLAVPDAEVLPRALAVASRIARLAPISVVFTKEAIVTGEDAALATGLSLERKMLWLLMGTDDKTEGMSAFLEKRKPTFKGR